jgi:DNA polymerase/3'-5' exonuclease PolX
MLNQLIIDNFKKLIQLVEYETNNLTDKKQITINNFRIASLKKSLKVIMKFDKKIINTNQIADLKGIGKGTINRVDEILCCRFDGSHGSGIIGFAPQHGGTIFP